MHRSIILFGLLFSLNACNQAPEQNDKEHTTSNQISSKPNNVKSDITEPNITESSSVEKTDDEGSYPLFFIEVAKNLNISTEEFAQAMASAGDNDASMESVAEELGVSMEDLQAALPKLPPKKITFVPGEDVEVIKSTSDEKTNKQ